MTFEEFNKLISEEEKKTGGAKKKKKTVAKELIKLLKL